MSQLRQILAVLATLFPSLAFADTVDGTLTSIDAEQHSITLETGVIFNLGQYVVLDGLVPGQVIRVSYTEGTMDATAVDVLEQPPVEPVDPVETPDVSQPEQ